MTTSINHDLVSPFLSPRSAEVAVEEPAIPFDDSVEGMRRLRDPFAVAPAAQPEPATHAGGSDRASNRSRRSV